MGLRADVDFCSAVGCRPVHTLHVVRRALMAVFQQCTSSICLLAAVHLVTRCHTCQLHCPPALPAAQVGRLRDGARSAAQQGDPITAFLYRQLIMCLLAHTSGTWDGQQLQQQQQSGTPLQQEGSGGSGGSASGVATPSVDAGTPARCAQDSSELPSLDASSLPAGSSTEPSLSPPRQQTQQPHATPEQQGSEAARFRQLMDTWQAGRGSPAAAPSPQQAPEPPGSAAQPVSPLSGERLVECGCSDCAGFGGGVPGYGSLRRDGGCIAVRLCTHHAAALGPASNAARAAFVTCRSFEALEVS